MTTISDPMTTREAARLSGYTQEHVALLVRRGLVKGVRFGHVWMISRRSFEDYLKQARSERNGRYGPK